MTFLIFCLFFALAAATYGQVQDSVLLSTDSVHTELSEPDPEFPESGDSEIDSLPIRDSLSLKQKKEKFLYRVFVKDYPNPNMALYLSLALPGAGQLYNKRWWKLPFVYGAYAGLVASIDFNTKRYKSFRDAYIAELKGEKHPFSDTRLRADDLRRIRDNYDKNKQVSYIGMVAVHLLQATEAFVDAHLRTFDISDDLSLRLSPSLQNDPFKGITYGAGLSLSFR